MTDEQLLSEAGRGSRPAFEALFDRYRSPMWAFFRRRVREAARAEELVQDVFVAALQGASRFEGRGSCRAFLFGIAFNVLKAEWRRAGRNACDPLGDEVPTPPADLDAGRWVRRALAQLDAGDREILMLREYEQLRYDELAEVLRLPVNTVRSRLFRARMALKSALLQVEEERKATLGLGPLPVSTRLRNALVDGVRTATASLVAVSVLLLNAGHAIVLWVALLWWPARALVRAGRRILT